MTLVFVDNSGQTHKKPPFANPICFHPFKSETPSTYNFAINNVGIKIIADPIESDNLLIDFSERVIIVIAPIKCKTSLCLIAQTVLIFAPMECSANKIAIKCTKAIVAYGGVEVHPKVSKAKIFKRCAVNDFNVDRLISLLSEVKKETHDFKLLFSALMECWLLQHKKGATTYTKGLKFYNVDYDDFEIIHSTQKVCYYTLSPDQKAALRPLPEKALEHMQGCESCDQDFNKLSLDLKGYLIYALRYQLLREFVRNLGPEGRVSKEYLAGIGLLERCDLKNPIFHWPKIYNYKDLLGCIEEARGYCIHIYVKLTEEEIQLIKKLVYNMTGMQFPLIFKYKVPITE